MDSTELNVLKDHKKLESFETYTKPKLDKIARKLGLQINYKLESGGYKYFTKKELYNNIELKLKE